ncbi:MAG: pentapeptide repeat-containing protein, partial [Flavobacteriaceae bacterium]|nr:pentapeptide repeat-containing protein [Flavobacteriaceae bacterium]
VEIDLSDADLTMMNLEKADLMRANLSKSDLFKANLSEANLIKANLSGANLSEAKFYEAYLSKADLSYANLYGAVLNSADLNWSNLSGADLRKANINWASLSGANLTGANLTGANLLSTNIMEANLSGKAQLIETNLNLTNLFKANLTGANLSRASLAGANLTKTNLSGADLSGACLVGTSCIETNFSDSIIDNAEVYGISVWNINSVPASQQNLIITQEGEPIVTVDNLKVAQFIYLLLNNEEIRDVLGTIAKKGVLILGRFTPERKKILDAVRKKLRELDFVPMMFDFEKVEEKDFTETIKILAGMSRFVIADITDPSSVPLELQATVPDYEIPFAPIIQNKQKPFSMFKNLKKYPWMLRRLEYDSETDLMEVFQEGILERLLGRENELKKNTEEDLSFSTKDFKKNK